jgi:hypothetical protein
MLWVDLPLSIIFIAEQGVLIICPTPFKCATRLRYAPVGRDG